MEPLGWKDGPAADADDDMKGVVAFWFIPITFIVFITDFASVVFQCFPFCVQSCYSTA